MNCLESDGMAVACIWSIACLTKGAAPLISLSIAQHLTNFTIFGQSRSTLAIELGLGLVLEVMVRLAQLAKCIACLVKCTLTKCALHGYVLFSNFTEHLQFEEKKEYVEILSNVGLHVDPYISGNNFVHW